MSNVEYKNFGANVSARFCPPCGQKSSTDTIDSRYLLNEIITNFVQNVSAPTNLVLILASAFGFAGFRRFSKA